MPITIVLNTKEPEMFLLSENEDLEAASGIEGDVNFFTTINGRKVAVNSRNYKCLFTLPGPIILDVEKVGEDGNTSDHSDTSLDEPSVILDNTIKANDLSTLDNTQTKSRDRWEELEEAILKNFYKWCVRHIKKPSRPGYEDLATWLRKRKASKSQLFGGRSESAILSHFKLMADKGEFKIV